MHANLVRQAAAFEEVAGLARCDHVGPARPSAARARHDVIEVSSWVGNVSAQYWQRKRSRRNTLNRVKAGRRDCCTNSFSEMTEGSRIEKDGLCTSFSYSEMMLTRSRKTAFTTSCHGHSDRGK
jgi:hypothetical protein